MNNWRICWFFKHIVTGILVFKGLAARRLYKSFGVRGLIQDKQRPVVKIMKINKYHRTSCVQERKPEVLKHKL
jgi:hypothetical protein